jgi:hypothetical protein
MLPFLRPLVLQVEVLLVLPHPFQAPQDPALFQVRPQALPLLVCHAHVDPFSSLLRRE